MNISLHIFTNATHSAPSTAVIERTWDSFTDVFGELPTTVWCDPNPNRGAADAYLSQLKGLFQDVQTSRSLSDGYCKAVMRSDAEYLFILEHDWLFVKSRIRHDLAAIIDAMKSAGLYHFRFNKRANNIGGWDTTLKPGRAGNGIEYCLTPNLSNNPHLIHRETALSYIRSGVIKVLPGSKGIEEKLAENPYTYGAIYGGIGYEATIKHQDGRRRR